jgi:peroxiredoxin
LHDRYDEVQGLGGDVIAIGTGNVRYAASFVDDEHVPFPVLVDDHSHAAHAAQVKRVNFRVLLFDKRSREGAKAAHDAGHRIHWPGKRTNQLGATFVIAPGNAVVYEHIDDHSADHAPLDEVIAALGKATGVAPERR